MKKLLLERSNYRSLPPDYRGDILLWDIDKTYLDTRFSSARGLMGIVVEAALDKQAIPGAVPLIRALRRGPSKHSSLVPLYFVSGSPPQLRTILERKMLLDGVEFDGITFKDQWGLLKARRPKAIREQVGYKLCALLLYRLELPDGARWLLFGDDIESDAEVFALFGEVCAGLRGHALSQRLMQMNAAAPESDAAIELASRLPITPDPVERIFIRLEQRRPEQFHSRNVTPTRSFLQTAMVLAQLGRVTRDTVSVVAEDLRRNLVTDATVTSYVTDARDRLKVPEDILALAAR